MRHTSILVLAALVTAGCTASAKMAVSPASLTRPAAATPKTMLMGLVTAPASLITNNGSSLVANNSGTLITNGAANWRTVLAVEAEAPVADAEVLVLDANDQPVAGVQPTRTDAQGRFTLQQVPTGANVQVVVKKPGYSLTSITRAVDGGKPIAVTPASTLVAAHLKKELGQDKKALAQVSEAALTELTESVEEVLDKGDVPLDLTSTEQALKGYTHVMTKHPELATQGMAAVAAAQSAAKENLTPDAVLPDGAGTEPVTPAASHKPDNRPSPNPAASDAPATPPSSTPAKDGAGKPDDAGSKGNGGKG